MMKAKDTCIGCGLEIWFEKKDIKKVSKTIIKNAIEQNRIIQNKLDETVKSGFIFKKEGYAISYRPFREMLRDLIKIPVGFITCPACGQKQLILKAVKVEQGE